MPLAVRNKDFLSVLDFEPAELEACLTLAERLKRERSLGPKAPTADALGGAHVAMLFEKPSLRTISTFEIAVRELGGNVITPFPDVALSPREPVIDVARNLERWVKCAVIRTYAHAIVVEFAKAAPRMHVINALTDQEHPCQALADFQTLREAWGGWAGRTLAFIGDGNNVATSVAQAGVMLGVNIHIASPDGYELPAFGGGAGIRRRPARRADPPLQRSGGSRERRGCGLHRRVDVDGAGSGDGGTEKSFRRIPGDIAAHAAGRARWIISALPARASRRRSVRRGVGIALSRSSSIRPKTGCTRKRRCSTCSWRKPGASADGRVNLSATPGRLHLCTARDPHVPATLSPYPDKTLVDYLRDSASAVPGEPALFFKGGRLSFKELDTLSDRFAATLNPSASARRQCCAGPAQLPAISDRRIRCVESGRGGPSAQPSLHRSRAGGASHIVRRQDCRDADAVLSARQGCTVANEHPDRDRDEHQRVSSACASSAVHAVQRKTRRPSHSAEAGRHVVSGLPGT